MKRVFYASLIGLVLQAAAYAAGDPAPSVRLQTEQGEVGLEAYRGRVVYVDFWASWCAPCRKSFPWMQTMQQRYGDQGLTVLAVNLDSDRQSAARFLRDQAVDFTIAYDPEGRSAEQFNVPGMPSSYLIDRAGRVRARHVGFLDKNASDIELALQSLLSE